MNEKIHQLNEAAMAGTITIGTLIGALPAIAALFSIIWLTVQIYESKTGQYILNRLKEAFRRKL